jgi:hypothetical protein
LSYKTSGKNSTGIVAKIDYNTINIAAGVRCHLYADKNWKLILDGGVIKDIKQRSVTVTPAFALGISYKRLILESRYFFLQTQFQNVFDNTQYSKFSNISLLLKFDLVDK